MARSECDHPLRACPVGNGKDDRRRRDFSQHAIGSYFQSEKRIGLDGRCRRILLADDVQKTTARVEPELKAATIAAGYGPKIHFLDLDRICRILGGVVD